MADTTKDGAFYPAWKIGVGGAIALLSIYGLISLLGSRPPVQPVVEKVVEIIPAKVGKWTRVVTNPRREMLKFDVSEGGFEYLIVINRDFRRQIPFSTYSDLDESDFGNGVTNIHISLVRGQREQVREIKIIRIRK